VTRRMLGAALRRHRVGRGFSLDDAARMLGCDRSKVSRIEAGLRGVRERDLLDLLAEYGVGDDERAALLAIAGPRAGGGWWQGYAGVLPPAALEYVGLEAAASRARRMACRARGTCGGGTELRVGSG
jgi:transcriptional regulator with XRE-family HTH domain